MAKAPAHARTAADKSAVSRVRRRLEALGWLVIVGLGDDPFELIAMPSRRSEPVIEIQALPGRRWLGVSSTGWWTIPGNPEGARDELRKLARAHGGTACFLGLGGRLEP